MAQRLDPTFVRQQIELLRVTHPEVWDGDEELLADMLEGSTDLHEFLTAAVRLMRKAEANAKGARADADEYAAPLMLRAARFEQRSEALRALAFRLMQWADVRKLELVPATLSIRAGQPRVIITDEAALPDNCVRIKREPHKTMIRELIDQGVPVQGAELSNSEPQLAVRIK
jgi:hypothetical protein